MMCRCAAIEVANKNVIVNAVGSNIINYSGFKHMLGSDKDPMIMKALLEEIPAGRLVEGQQRQLQALKQPVMELKQTIMDGGYHNSFLTVSIIPSAVSGYTDIMFIKCPLLGINMTGITMTKAVYPGITCYETSGNFIMLMTKIRRFRNPYRRPAHLNGVPEFLGTTITRSIRTVCQ